MNNISGTKILCMALATLILSMILIPAGSAAIAVKEGDWAKYKIEAKIPEIQDGGTNPFEEVDWMKVEVKSVSDTTVTLKGTIHYNKNGTEMVQTVDGTESGFIIDTDLTEDEVMASFEFFGAFWPGEPTYTSGTASRKYAGANREVQYVETHMEGYGASLDLKAYWDKAKGVLCEISMLTSAGGMTMSISAKMIETNMWGNATTASSGQWLWILAVVVIIVAVVVAGSAVLLWRRRKAPLPEATPAPTE